jgi:hypothetical protein
MNEMAQALEGDWFIKDDLGSISTIMLQKEWNYVEDLYGMKLYKSKSSYAWILGIVKDVPGQDKPRLGVTFRIDFKNAENIGNKFGINHLYNVDEVGVSKDKRGFGLASAMYSYFIKKHNYTILGSDEQFFGARKLWASLSKRLDLTVDIIDVKNNRVLEKDTIIHHGDLDEEFDKRVWSYDIDKKHIRLILKDIK